jgi:hypothetical protein
MHDHRTGAAADDHHAPTHHHREHRSLDTPQNRQTAQDPSNSHISGQVHPSPDTDRWIEA